MELYKRKSSTSLVPYVYIVIGKIEGGYKIVEIHSRPEYNVIKLITEELYSDLELTNIYTSLPELKNYSSEFLYRKWFQLVNLIKYLSWERKSFNISSEETEIVKLIEEVVKLIEEKDASNI